MPHTFQPDITFAELVGPLDWCVFAIAQVATIAAVVFGHRRRRAVVKGDADATFLDVMLMGRQLTLPLFIATLVATWYGGIFGVTAIAFNDGIYNFITQGVFWYVTYLIFAFCIAHKVAAFNALTLPELVGRMFGPRAGRLSAIFNFFNVLPIAYAISIGIFLQVMFGGTLLQMMLLGMAFVVLYTMWGGFRAVVFSDVIQCLVMCTSVAAVLVWSVGTFGGWSFLRANLPATHFTPTGTHTWAEMLVWNFVALATLVDPNFYQRCFAAKSPGIARRGIIISTLVWCCFDICTTAGGMYARAVIPAAAADQAYMLYALQLLPQGLRGLFLAGIAATILSTLDAFLFVAGNTLTYDLVPARWKGRVNLQRVGVVIAGLLAVGLGQVFGGNISETWKTLGSYAAACLLL
ncbi:MAG: sodium:solute symporter family protein, partial [Verrucomicrobia bacterium]|nr:sodium:solute symporter family protein [Verrucomicrobiota bacterium]